MQVTTGETRGIAFSAWPVAWTAAWVGALTSLAVGAVLGLIGTIVGAASIRSFSSWSKVSFVDLLVAICVAFFAGAAGGWVAGRISGFRHAEPAILHSAIAFLIGLPMVLVLTSLGAAGIFNSWLGGAVVPFGSAIAQSSPEVVRGTALAALTAVLVGLIGSVIGGWIAAGEPMTFSHYRTRQTRMFLTEEGEIR